MKFYPFLEAKLYRYPIIALIVFFFVWLYNSYKLGKFNRKNRK